MAARWAACWSRVRSHWPARGVACQATLLGVLLGAMPAADPLNPSLAARRLEAQGQVPIERFELALQVGTAASYDPESTG